MRNVVLCSIFMYGSIKVHFRRSSLFNSTQFFRFLCLLFILIQSERAAGQCSSVETLYCGLPTTTTGSGQGPWSITTNCNIHPTGQVKVYRFTPPIGGTYSLHVTNATGGTVDYFYKPAAAACGQNDWTCIASINAPGTQQILPGMSPFQEYLLLAVGHGNGSYEQTFQIDCPTVDPCNNYNITTLSCGMPTSVELAGVGAWNNNACGFSTPGEEKIFKFTANVSGTYNIFFLGGGGFPGIFDYMYKEVTAGCSSTGWTCSQRLTWINPPGNYPIGNLTAGKEYYLMVDAEQLPAETQIFMISCPDGDPCSSVTNLSCGASVTASMTGQGQWNSNACNHAANGKEKLYSFTPSASGSYSLQVIGGSGNINYMYKAVSDGCSATGWNCIGFADAPGNYMIGNLTAGVQYYILADAETTGTTSQTFFVNCWNPCNSITALACSTAVTFSQSGFGAWNNSPCLSGTTIKGKEQIYSYTPTNTGPYAIKVNSASGGTVTYQYQGSGCSSSGWTCIGSTNQAQTFPTFNLTAGITYYFLLDAVSEAATAQNFQLNCLELCDDKTVIECEESVTADMGQDNGLWQLSVCGGGQTGGKEKFFSFTPTVTGPHSLEVTYVQNWVNYAAYYIKQASSQCTQTGWTCIAYTNQFPKTFSLGNLTAGVEYIILVDAQPPGFWPTVHQFRIHCPPACPTLLSPADGATICPDPTLSWQSAAGADSYDVHLGTSSTPPLYTQTGSTSVSVGPLSAGTKYWQVRPRNNYFTNNTCPVRSFTAKADPQGDLFSNPIVISSQSYFAPGDNGTADCWSNDYTGANNQPSADVFYRITVTACNSRVNISTCYSTMDTYLHLLNSAGTEVLSNDNNGPLCSGSQASIQANNLTPGTYYIVVEGAGTNTGSYYLDVAFYDITPPVLNNCPANPTVSVNASCQAILPDYTGVVTVSDNCPGSLSAFQWPEPGTNINGSVQVTLSSYDIAANLGTCTFTVTAADNTPPTITCPGAQTLAVNGSCQAILPNYAASASASDNCSSPAKTQTPVSGTSLGLGTTLVTLKATDGAGNSSTCTFNVSVTDQTPPAITCPANITVNSPAGVCGATVNYSVTSTDNCAGTASTLTLLSGQASGTLFPVMTTTVSYRATDPSSNSATCSFTVKVTDTEPPVNTCPPAQTVSSSSFICGAEVTYATPTASDNCSVSSNLRQSGPASGFLFAVGTTTVVYRATDPSGNTATCSFTVTVNDTHVPVLTCPAAQTLSNNTGICGATVTYTTPAATDNCSVSSNVLVTGQASGTVFPVGTTTVVYRATDPSGNSSTCSFTVTVNDTQLPAITCPSGQTLSNDADVCGATVTYSMPTASDNCPVSTMLVSGQASGTVFPTGTTTVNYRATDPSGNSATCSFTVTVNDTQLPVLTCPANMTLNNDPAVCGATVTYSTPVPLDNCSASNQLVLGQASGTVFPIGITTVRYHATDPSGNTASCSFTVKVNDTQLPVITCPGGQTVSNDPGVCGAMISYAAPTASDNCPVSSNQRISGPASGTVFPIGTTVVVYRAADPSGNTATCSFLVTVNDTQLPSITCPAGQTTSNNTGICGATVTYTTPAASDNCSVSSNVLVTGQASGTVFPVGTTPVVYRATDPSGNSSTCSFTVTVNDTQLPVITCPSIPTMGNNPGVCGANVSYSVNAWDNCSVSSNVLVSGQASGTVFPVGTTFVVYRATDPSGNSSTCSFTVTVNDTQLPVITCPGSQILSNNPNLCGATVAYGMPVASDNCSVISNLRISGPASGTVFPIGTTTVIYRAADPSGNSSTCSFAVTVNDMQVPVITCPGSQTLSNNLNVCGATVTYSTSVASDNCSVTSNVLVSGQATGTVFPVGTSIIIYRATDPSGNSSTCSFSVTVNDVQTPVINCPANITQGNATGQCGANVSFSNATATDNCTASPSIVNLGAASGSFFAVGTTTVSFRATDASNNAATCSFSVTVNDTQAPIITCPTNITANNSPAETCSAVVNYSSPSATDNCAVGSVMLTSGQASGYNFPVGIITNMWQAMDMNNNSSTCSFTVQVKDVTLPSITCPPNQTVPAGTSCTGIVGSWTPVSLADNCSPAPTFEQTPIPSTVLSGHNDSELVTLTATDASNNKAICTFTVTLKDITPPVAKCNNATINLGATGTVTVAPSAVNNGSTDNCGLTLTLTPNTFGCATLGPQTVVLKATDSGGNTSTCTAIVIIKDLTPPTALCKTINVYLDEAGHAFITPAAVNNNSYDACGIATMSININQFDCSQISGAPVTVQLTLRDVNNNVSSCLANVNVKDAMAPTAVCTNTSVSLNQSGYASVATAPLASNSTDNCSVWSYSPAAKVYTSANLGVNNLSITVKDWSNNSASCVSQVTVYPYGVNSNLIASGHPDDVEASMPWNPQRQLDLSLFPNPTSGETTLLLRLGKDQAYRLRLFDTTGRLILDANYEGVAGENLMLLELGELGAGVYWVDVLGTDGHGQEKLLLEK